MKMIDGQQFAHVEKRFPLLQKTPVLKCSTGRAVGIAKKTIEVSRRKHPYIEDMMANGAASALDVALSKPIQEKTMQNKATCLIGNAKAVWQKQESFQKTDLSVMQ